jgi:hypothetical protein
MVTEGLLFLFLFYFQMSFSVGIMVYIFVINVRNFCVSKQYEEQVKQRVFNADDVVTQFRHLINLSLNCVQRFVTNLRS